VNGLALCAGVGGLELGIELAVPGYRSVGYVERDAFAAATLVARMEEEALDPAPIWDDLSTFDGRPWRGAVDIVSAGFPCQPFSVAGKGLGVEDERWLWPDVERIIREVQPGWVFLENVPLLVSRGLWAVLGGLAVLGYDARWDLFSAKECGAPHGRRRLFLVAQRISNPIRNPIWDLPERGSGSAFQALGGDAVARDMVEGVVNSGHPGGGQSREVRPGGDAAGGTGEAVAVPESGRLGELREPSGSEGQPDGDHEAVAHPESHDRGPELQPGESPEHRGSGPPGSSGNMAHPGCEGLEGCRGTETPDAGDGSVRREEGPAAEGGDLLADAHGGGFEVERIPDESGEPGERWYEFDRCHLPLFPPGPEDFELWERVLSIAPEVEPALCGVAHGVAYRVDSLRTCGNGVVPLQAAIAYRTLLKDF
jgi:DNA (cytosine-5)-methyltransferase 1